MDKIILYLPYYVTPIIENDAHLTIIFDRIGGQIVTPDKYLFTISDDHFRMNIRFFDHFPVPR